jgi:hypothetical protein
MSQLGNEQVSIERRAPRAPAQLKAAENWAAFAAATW